MRNKALALAFLSVALQTVARAEDFRLGLNYSEAVPITGVAAISYFDSSPQVTAGSDAEGFIYLLVNGAADAQGTSSSAFYVVKLNPAGNQITYQAKLDFRPAATLAIAVSRNGNAYVAGDNRVEKVDGTGKASLFATVTPTALVNAIAVDSSNRVYVTGITQADLPTTTGALLTIPPVSANNYSGFVARLESSGAVGYATYVGGSTQASPSAIAVDPSGSAFVAGAAFPAGFPTSAGAYLPSSAIPNRDSASFLLRLSPDGSSLIYATFVDAQAYNACCLAVDSNGSAVLAFNLVPGGAAVARLNPQGTALDYTAALPAATPQGLVLDSSGMVYVVSNAAANFPVKNSLAPCVSSGSTVLSVLDQNGSFLQSTYVPGSVAVRSSIGLGADSSVFVAALPDSTFAATHFLGGSSPGVWSLTSFVRNDSAPVAQLACLGNSASYDSEGISGGEVVSLYGQSLGPAEGVQPERGQHDPYPTKLAGVEVTFNGTGAPLLYVQDGQINAVAPWSLPARQDVRVCVTYNGMSTNCILRPGFYAHPGIFMSGGAPIVFNQDFTLNSPDNPAKLGSYATIFATGLGPIDPPQPDGSVIEFPLPLNALSSFAYWTVVEWFGPPLQFNLNLQYAGPAPFRVSGVSQINFLVDQITSPLSLRVLVPEPAPAESDISNPFSIYIAPQ